jgi:plasmid stability protein
MSVLTVRNIPDDVHRGLRVRAAKAHRSMEAEARAILADACTQIEAPITGAELQAWCRSLYGGHPPAGAVDDLIAERRREAARE